MNDELILLVSGWLPTTDGNGLIALRDRLSAAGKNAVYCTYQQDLVNLFLKSQCKRLKMAGHSFGFDSCVKAAASLISQKVDVDVLFGMDGVSRGWCYSWFAWSEAPSAKFVIPANVKRAYSVKNPGTFNFPPSSPIKNTSPSWMNLPDLSCSHASYPRNPTVATQAYQALL